MRRREGGKTLQLRGIALSFGNVKAIDGLDLDVAPGRIHGLIGPNGSGKTTTLNVISGYYGAKAGSMTLGDAVLPAGQPVSRAACGIARTFQNIRLLCP
ncbi:ATP-binding cassette domain-containing protein, partial [Bradyrhizobium uaiense]|uniref:ATP-binding cassette domain-containing protein n=1 Tax=Bradyrhizobium uaiense TaxID=2594946 RepID=UPI003221B810